MPVNRRTETPEITSQAKNVKPRKMRLDLRIALAYAFFGGLWILFSDSLLDAFVHNHDRFARIQTYKGWAFVVLGAVLLFLLLRRELNALDAAEQKYSAIFNKGPYAAALAELPEGVFADVNDEFVNTFGYSRAEALGKTSLELGMYPDLAERQRSADTMRAHGFVRNIEMQLRTKAGELRNFLVSTDILEIGGETFVLTTAKDITERKRAEEEIHLSRERLAELSRRLVEAHETEARAIGRELHDQFGQMLTALKLTLEIAPQLPPELAAKKYAQAQELLDDLMNRVSALSLELRPPMLDDLGLVPALLWLVNRFHEQTQIEVDFKHSGVEGRRFISEIETTAYRMTQEALTNVARHARADRARLEVRVRGEQMEIQISDDGAGFDVESALAKNRGLGGIRERVNLVGGSFQVESQIGNGTRKIIRLPL